MTAPPLEQEALRRRLYAPGATEQDRAAYRDLVPSPEDTPRPRATAASVGPPTRFRGARALVLLGAAAAGALATVAVGVATAERPAALPSVAPATPVPVATAAAIPVGSAAREAFTTAVAAGETPGLRAWFADHPGEVPTAIRSASDVAVTLRAGSGPADLDVLPPVTWRAQAITVLLVTDRDAAATWTASRSILAGDDSRRLVPVAAAVAQVRAGVPVAAGSVLTRSVPGHLSLHLPPGTRWSLAVVFSGTTSSAVRGGGGGIVQQ